MVLFPWLAFAPDSYPLHFASQEAWVVRYSVAESLLLDGRLVDFGVAVESSSAVESVAVDAAGTVGCSRLEKKYVSIGRS